MVVVVALYHNDYRGLVVFTFHPFGIIGVVAGTMMTEALHISLRSGQLIVLYCAVDDIMLKKWLSYCIIT